MATALTLFQQQLSDKLPASAFIEDYPRRYAFGTDASFYRLVPQLIVLVADQQQAQQVISAAATYKVAITFRAAGTSLSGQAITDSVLVLLSDCWSGYQIEDNGAAIRLEPAIIGARANAVLAPFGRKIGPDPASINSCKIAGMAANNSSGMCCGVAQNSYHTVKDMTLIFADGTVLDTRSEQSRSKFLHSHKPFINDITALAQQVTNNPELAQRIAHKYRLKNTTGYGLNALIDYTDPIEIIKHLMIGSEGTLGFIADITYHTVIDHAHKSSAFIIFDDISQVCELVKQLATLDVAAVELLDKRSLLCVAHHDIMPKDVHNYPADSAALLIEVRAEDATKLVNLQQQVDQLVAHFSAHQLAIMAFSTDAKRNASLWNIR